MKTVVKLKYFNKAVSVCSRIVQSRNSLEILGNILISAKDNQLVLSATNLNLAIQTTLGAKVEQEGEISVPARILHDLVSSYSEDTIQLIADSNNLSLKSNLTQSRLNGVSAKEFPTIPVFTTKQTLDLPSSDFIEALTSVLVCVSNDESRPVLAGVLLSNQGKTLSVAATDSYRLAEFKLSTKQDEDFTCIVPARTLQEVARLLDPEESNMVNIQIGENEIKFSFDKTTITSQLTEGKYPDYTKIFPSSSNTNFLIDRETIIEAVKVSALFGRESSHGIILETTKSELSLQAQSSDLGENQSKIPIVLDGKPTEINLNAQYLLDVLSVLNSKEVSISLNDKLDPCVIKPHNKKKQYTHIIMPLRS